MQYVNGTLLKTSESRVAYAVMQPEAQTTTRGCLAVRDSCVIQGALNVSDYH